MKEILKVIINDLEAIAVGMAALDARTQHKDTKLTAELAYHELHDKYESLRKKVDALP